MNDRFVLRVQLECHDDENSVLFHEATLFTYEYATYGEAVEAAERFESHEKQGEETCKS